MLTGLVQSSGAALGIFLNLAQQGLLSVPAGISMTLGANVGTCLTAVLAALGQGEGPMRVAMALTLARAVGAALCCVWLWPLEVRPVHVPRGGSERVPQAVSYKLCGISLQDAASQPLKPDDVAVPSLSRVHVYMCDQPLVYTCTCVTLGLAYTTWLT